LLTKADQPNDRDDEDDDVANVLHMYKERNKVLREKANNNANTANSTTEGEDLEDSGQS